jgi:uncharacterized protein (DUF58 family)
MDSRLKELLKPEIINTMDGLELIARIVVEGFMSGSNKSHAVGVGQEFNQYRNYEPGDDLRQLDWKMYARSERYFIKQADIETNITVKFILDASNSMAHREQELSKLQFAKVMTAALGYLARKQGDTFGLASINNENIRVLQPRFEQQQFMRFLHELISIEANSSFKTQGLEQLLDHRGKEMIVFITDMYDKEGDILNFIGRLKTVRNEVIVFHLLGDNEIALNHNGAFTFKDLETGMLVKVDTRSQQKMYVEKVNVWLASVKNALLEKAINYQVVNMEKAIDQTLRDFLKARKTLLR